MPSASSTPTATTAWPPKWYASPPKSKYGKNPMSTCSMTGSPAAKAFSSAFSAASSLPDLRARTRTPVRSHASATKPCSGSARPPKNGAMPLKRK